MMKVSSSVGNSHLEAKRCKALKDVRIQQQYNIIQYDSCSQYNIMQCNNTIYPPLLMTLPCPWLQMILSWLAAYGGMEGSGDMTLRQLLICDGYKKYFTMIITLFWKKNHINNFLVGEGGEPGHQNQANTNFWCWICFVLDHKSWHYCLASSM